jgi:hypothetical protein
MLMVRIALAGIGVVLLIAGPLLARLLVGRRAGGGDPVGLARVLQAFAVVLLVTALLLRSGHKVSAFGPPPDEAGQTPR